MKKIIASFLALCLSVGAPALSAVALSAPVDNAAAEIQKATLADGSLFTQDGLLYLYHPELTVGADTAGTVRDGALHLDANQTLATNNILDVVEYASDPDMIHASVDDDKSNDYLYNYTVTGRFSFNIAEAARKTAMNLAMLDLQVSSDSTGALTGLTALLCGREFALAVTSPAGASLDLTATVQMRPVFVHDGYLGECYSALKALSVNGTAIDDALIKEEGELIENYSKTISSKSFTFGGDVPMSVDYVAVYNRELTEIEHERNAFANLAYTYGCRGISLDYMTAEAQEAYFTPLMTAEAAGTLTADNAQSLVDEGIAAALALDTTYDYSDFIVDGNSEEKDWHIDYAEAHNELLTTAMANDWVLAPYFELDDDGIYEFYVNHYDSLDEITEESILSYFEETDNTLAAMKNALTFVGYQARKKGESAIRALFSVDNATVAQLEAQNLTVTYGIIKDDGVSFATQLAYGEGANLELVDSTAEETRFASTVTLETDAAAEDYNRVYVLGAFIRITDGTTTTTYTLDCSGSLGNKATVSGICSYFYANGFDTAEAIVRAAQINN